MAEKDQHHQPDGSKREKQQQEEEGIPIFSPQAGLPRKRRIKYCGIVVALVLLQVVVLGVLALTVFRFKDPDLKLAATSVKNMSMVLGTPTPTTINMTLREEIQVKNKNWGGFKYDEGAVVLSYGDETVGQGTISKGSIKMRHSKKVSVLVEAKIEGKGSDGRSSSEISEGVLNLRSYSKLSGKVNMMGLVKKRRNGEMNCTLTINLARQAIQDFNCH